MPSRKRRECQASVGISTMGGIFVHKSGKRRAVEKATLRIRETARQETRTAAQQAAVFERAPAMALAAAAEFRQLARTPVPNGTSPFAQTNCAVPDLRLQADAKADEHFLAPNNGSARSRGTGPHADPAAADPAEPERTVVRLCGPIPSRHADSYCRRGGQGPCPFDPHAGLPTPPLPPAVE